MSAYEKKIHHCPTRFAAADCSRERVRRVGIDGGRVIESRNKASCLNKNIPLYFFKSTVPGHDKTHPVLPNLNSLNMYAFPSKKGLLLKMSFRLATLVATGWTFPC